MRRLTFAAILCSSLTGTFTRMAGAQAVPGRDLLRTTIGTVGELPPLATETGDGVWNPATIGLPASVRGRVAVGAVDGSLDQGLDAQVVAGAVALPVRLSVGLSVLHARVTGLVRTETDPQSIGGEIPYGTTLVSLAVARRQNRYLTTGLALRYRSGEIDAVRRGALGLDAGALATFPALLDAHVGASTFLWRPAAGGGDQPMYSVAADARVAGPDAAHQVRAGFAFSYTDGGGREQYVLASGRFARLSARVGLADLLQYGESEWRLRLGVGLHYARYVVGVAREENGAGLSPTYQFTLSALIR